MKYCKNKLIILRRFGIKQRPKTIFKKNLFLHNIDINLEFRKMYYYPYVIISYKEI